MELLTTQNAKTIKGEKKGWFTGILYLAPGKTAGGRNLCPDADAGCRRSCLFTAGRGKFDNIKRARIRKTQKLLADRDGFLEILRSDIKSLIRAAERKKMKAAVRLNGTSDIPWQYKAYGSLMNEFPSVTFYDYTKSALRVRHMPPNYHLTFSRGTNNDTTCKKLLKEGHSVAVVFDKVPVGEKFWGYPVVDGDESDLRFLDKAPCIVGLKAKGDARKDKTGFVIRTKEKK